jgi:hypothetical protein
MLDNIVGATGRSPLHGFYLKMNLVIRTVQNFMLSLIISLAP